MDALITAVYDGCEKASLKIWSKEEGWLIGPESLVHESEVWGEHAGSARFADNGRQGRLRMIVVLGGASPDAVFPEVFAARKAPERAVA